MIIIPLKHAFWAYNFFFKKMMVFLIFILEGLNIL